MPFIEPTNPEDKITFVRGRPRDILVRMFNPDGVTPLDTTGFTLSAWLFWHNKEDGETKVALSGASLLSIDNAGVITGQIQSVDFDETPRGRRSVLWIDVFDTVSAEPFSLIFPINLERGPV